MLSFDCVGRMDSIGSFTVRALEENASRIYYNYIGVLALQQAVMGLQMGVRDWF